VAFIHGPPVKNADGEIYAAQVISHDISDRRQMEEALKESEERFSLFTKHLPGLVFIKDHESRYLFTNQKLSDFFGIPASQLVGRTSQEVFSGEQARRYVDTDRQLMETGEPIVVREDFKRPDGETTIMLNHKFLINRPDRPPLIAGFYLDMTDRFRTEEELAATQGLLETAIAQSPSGIIIADAPDGKVRLINQAALKIKTGDNASRSGSESEKHTQEWDAHYPDGSPYPEEQLPHNRAVKNGETVRNEEFIIKNLAGEMHWVSANAAPIFNKNGEIEASIVILHDISEQKKLEQARRESEERFRAFFHSINDAIMVHPLCEVGFAPFSEVNQIACERYGYSAEEFSKLTAFDITKMEEVREHAKSEHRNKLLDAGQMVFESTHIKKIRGILSG
jgi:PAS domain S-box-containing protein